jgi:16S rRNA (cytidine1402-2'-O)-methyltransferase
LTKTYEEIRRGPLSSLSSWASGEQVRGEITVVLGGAVTPPAATLDELVPLVRARVAAGERLKDAAAAVAVEAGVSKRALYDAAVAAR